MNVRTKILAVDDSRMMLHILSAAIETLGFQPLRASNGEEAMTILDKQPEEIALVLLDWNMPVLDGLQTLREIRKRDILKDIPVMMVTTECERAHIVEAIQSGAQHYVTKPFAAQDLAVRIMEALGQGL